VIDQSGESREAFTQGDVFDASLLIGLANLRLRESSTSALKLAKSLETRAVITIERVARYGRKPTQFSDRGFLGGALRRAGQPF
jgi:hypothetical protein